ncbi:MAG: haloacid dehalogenase-like hydrolase [Lachnospiraceae bacterium]|nr:haloacid dehalogenase-like hydrolase [Lachnospiraceae bacterium]
MRKSFWKKTITLLSVTALISGMLTGCSNVDGLNVNINNPDKLAGMITDELENIGNEKAELEYWSEGSAAAASITDYVSRVTDESSGDYIPKEDRIAVFDLDGTLMGELYPSYFEYMMFIHRALHDDTYEAPEDMKEFAQALDAAVHNKGDMPENAERLHAKYAGLSHAGMTPDELREYTREFMNSEAEGFNNLTRGDAFYKPMVSLVKYLDANDFQCYVVSGSDRVVVRELIKDILPIPENRVIGMTYTMVASGQDGQDGLDYQFQPDDELVMGEDLVIKTIKMNKVSKIAEEIGKVPVLAFGNTSGDMSMQQYTVNNDQYEGQAYMVLCDDFEREYGNQEKVDTLTKWCNEHGVKTISMCEDFGTIYGDNVTLNREADNEIFEITMPEDLDGSYVIESRKNGYIVYDKEAREADFGGYAFSVYAYENPSDYAGGMDMKVGEIKKDDKTLYDVVIEYASDVQYDYEKYADKMPESYEKLYDGAEDIVKTLKPFEGDFEWGAGCEGKDMYSEVIDKHIKAIDEKWDSNKLEEEDMSPEYNALRTATGGDVLDAVGYAFFDTNHDGIEELLIGEIAEGDLKGTVYDIYTMEDRKPVHVISGSGRDRYYVLEHGLICNEYSGGADLSGWQSYDIEPNTTNLLPQLGVKIDGYEDKDNPWFANYGVNTEEWEKIDEETFDDYKSRMEYVRFDFTPLSEYEKKAS